MNLTESLKERIKHLRQTDCDCEESLEVLKEFLAYAEEKEKEIKILRKAYEYESKQNDKLNDTIANNKLIRIENVEKCIDKEYSEHTGEPFKKDMWLRLKAKLRKLLEGKD